MKIRKCKNGEINKIIEVANKAFKPDRTEDFTFRNSVPQIYNNSKIDYSSSHFVAENEDGQFVSVVGNLIDEIKIKGCHFKFSRIGTVGTLPEYRGQGLMKQLMAEVDKENQNKEVVFSVLCGKRNRYKNFGYERAGLTTTFTFDKDQSRYLKNKYNLSIKPFSQQDLSNVYDIYKNQEKFILRDKSNFEIYLNNKKRKLFSIFNKDIIIGYLSIKGSEVCEISLIDEKFAESVMSCLLINEIAKFHVNKYNNKIITVNINMLQRKLYEEFERITECKTLVEEKSFKVYDLKKFIKMCFLLSEKNIDRHLLESYQIENKIISFETINDNLKIFHSEEQTDNIFETKEEFIRFVLGSKQNNISSKIFPLHFDLNSVDNF